MINGFEEQTGKLTEEELKLVPLFIEGLVGRGPDDPVTSAEITNRLLERRKIYITGSRVRKIVNHIRMNRLLVNLIASSHGYYIEADEAKVKTYVESLVQRASAIMEVAKSYNVKPS